MQSAAQISSGPILTIQYLRGIAALLVVYHHTFTTSAASMFYGLAYGEIGVDIFFIISGFVMWKTTEGRHPSVLHFWRNRVVRIFPLWWCALTAWIALRIIIPDRLAGDDVTASTVIQSYLLIPHFHAVFTDHVWPILVPGWTLQFELYFYALFGLALFFEDDRTRLLAILSMLGVLAATGALVDVRHPAGWVATNVLLLEFGAGILLARHSPKLAEMPPIRGTGFILTGIVLSIAAWIAGSPENLRVLTSGVPAFMILGGAVILEGVARRHPSALLLGLGGASYSIYLFHGIVIAVLAGIWKIAGAPGLHPSAGLIFVPLAMMIATVGSSAVYLLVERRMIRFFRTPGSKESVVT